MPQRFLNGERCFVQEKTREVGTCPFTHGTVMAASRYKTCSGSLPNSVPCYYHAPCVSAGTKLTHFRRNRIDPPPSERHHRFGQGREVSSIHAGRRESEGDLHASRTRPVDSVDRRDLRHLTQHSPSLP